MFFLICYTLALLSALHLPPQLNLSVGCTAASDQPNTSSLQSSTLGKGPVQLLQPDSMSVPRQSPGSSKCSPGTATECIPGLVLSSQQFKAKIHQTSLPFPYLAQQKPVCKGLIFRQPALTTVNLLLSSLSLFFFF